LVVVEQASKFLLNYLLLGAQNRGGPRLAFWGHGENFRRSSASRLGEFIKRKVSRYPHWWFAYTEGSAATVRALGYPSERITVVQNAIDTVTLRDALRRLPPAAVSTLRESLGLRGANTAIYIGGLYPGKQLDFLLAASQVVRQLVADFELLIVGAGPEEASIRRAAASAPWIRYVGPQFGTAKVPFCALAKVLLLPAVAGLTVVDSFALEVPMVTLAGDHHPPEFEYLINGVNAMVAPAGSNPEAYARVVVHLLQSEDVRVGLKRNCRIAAETYTLEAMVRRFADGALAALAAPRHR
jgi:glycosyltransferase involved in cell wall biosynthesis